ncbi:MAG: alpha/beta hydrolase [Planctomycetota bacterium]|nr:alpha/beta hydrolase [Planctomycetota bacterium]
MFLAAASRPFSRSARSLLTVGALVAAAAAGAVLSSAAPEAGAAEPAAAASSSSHALTLPRVRYHTVNVEGVDIFYREAGPKDAPAILLLHGFPTSSHMFRNLIPQLAQNYRVIAPDYPGYGQSATPSHKEFEYTFDNLARVVDAFTRKVELDRFAVYLQDYGAPIGFRIAAASPERITGLIIQNGNAYLEGLPDSFWGPIKTYWADPTEKNRAALNSLLTIDATRWQYTTGIRDVANVSPDAWTIDQAGMDRPGNKDIQLDLFLSYGSNPPLYPAWQQYFRTHQPPTLIVWGKNDPIFPEAGAHPYLRDLKNVDFNLLDTGHFALEEDHDVIARKILAFMQERVQSR